MATMIDLKDIDAAASLKSKLDAVVTDLQGIVSAQKSTASDIQVLNRSVGLNEQAAKYLSEISDELTKIIPNLETVSVQLGNGIKSMQGFQEMQRQDFLNRV
jgi:septation ring formation regulator EzrA